MVNTNNSWESLSSAQCPSGSVSALRLGGRAFNPWPGRTKEKWDSLPPSLLLSIKASPNDYRAQHRSLGDGSNMENKFHILWDVTISGSLCVVHKGFPIPLASCNTYMSPEWNWSQCLLCCSQEPTDALHQLTWLSGVGTYPSLKKHMQIISVQQY